MRTSVVRRRLAAVIAAAAAVVLATALPASAHVGVSSPDAEPGDFGKLVFRVPNESDAATTTRLQVSLPADSPFLHVSTGALPGWNVKTKNEKLDQPMKVSGATITEAITTVTWTAEDGGGIPVGQFEEFEISAGPFPESVDSMTFPTIQTYSDGEIRAWDQVAKEGAEEPESPAPVLELGTAEDAAPVAATETTTQATGNSTDAATVAADSSDGVARTLGGIAVLLAAGALVWTVLSGRRARS